MVVFGGYRACMGHLNELWILDLHSMTWTSPDCLGTPPTPRRGHGAATIEKNMYVFGGFDGTSHLCDIYALNLQNFSWELLSTQGQTPTPRRHHTLEVVGNNLVIYGGYDGERYLEDVYSLDVNSGIWRCLDIMKPKTKCCNSNDIGGGAVYERSLHTMNVENEQLVIFGGVNEQGSLQDVMFLENNLGKTDGLIFPHDLFL